MNDFVTSEILCDVQNVNAQKANVGTDLLDKKILDTIAGSC